MKKIAIVGAGPSGVYCALCLLSFGIKNIEIFEKKSPLSTLLPTGGGRCNLTHRGDNIKEFAKNYPRGEKFLYSIFSKHFVSDTLEFFSKIGIETYVQEDERYFPKSNSSSDMRKKMLSALCTIKIKKQNITSKDELKEYDFIVISTGSKDRYRLAQDFGHSIIEPKPSLCGLKLSQNSPKYPQGVVLKTKDGDVLFTKDGISGPLVYTISSLRAREKFPYKITLPLINEDKLTQQIKNNPKKSFGNMVCEFIPKSLAHVILQNYDKQCANVSKKEIEELKTITFEVVSTDNKGEIVTSGGVNLKEIDKYCRSKLEPRVFFCGEVMDIDGFCGGYNLQNCWSSAYCAAEKISEIILRKEKIYKQD